MKSCRTNLLVESVNSLADSPSNTAIIDGRQITVLVGFVEFPDLLLQFAL